MKTLDEYMALYEQKTGEAFEFNSNFSFFYEPEHGFCEYNATETDLYIWQMCGDLKYWINIAYETARRMGLNTISSFVVRKPKPFIRALGFKIVDSECVDNCYRYTCENKAGETMVVTQRGDRHTFVWHIKEGEANV